MKHLKSFKNFQINESINLKVEDLEVVGSYVSGIIDGVKIVAKLPKSIRLTLSAFDLEGNKTKFKELLLSKYKKENKIK